MPSCLLIYSPKLGVGHDPKEGCKSTKNSLLIVLEGTVCAVKRYANSPCPFPVMWIKPSILNSSMADDCWQNDSTSRTLDHFLEGFFLLF